MDYDKLLISKRRRESNKPKKNISEETESDRARLIFSNSFRRLHQKAQVFPLDDNSAVRTRLTHSLEVAHLGKAIAKKITAVLIKKKKLNAQLQLAFIDIVEVACLLHDIGNPPFGHFGEYAMKSWCKKYLNSLLKAKEFSNTCKELWDNKLSQDFDNFDGNAQGFRIITLLQWSISEHGLNLLYPQLAASVKYLCAPYQLDDKGFNKPGYFWSEENIVKSIWEELGLKEYQKFPLNLIVEAADDIAYCLSDIDDAIEKNLIVKDKFEQLFGKMINKDYKKEFKMFYKGSPEQIKIYNDKYFWFKINLNNKLINFSAQEYLENNHSILQGNFEGSLLKGKSFECHVLKQLKAFSKANIYSQREAENIELAGYSVITGILDYFFPLLILDYDHFHSIYNNKDIKGFDLEKRLINRLPRKHKLAYSYETKLIKRNPDFNILELYYRIHLILDFVAGMTDSFALQMHQLLKGINIEENI